MMTYINDTNFITQYTWKSHKILEVFVKVVWKTTWLEVAAQINEKLTLGHIEFVKVKHIVEKINTV